MTFEIDVFTRIVFYVNNSTERYAIKKYCENKNLVEKEDYLIIINEPDEC